MLYYRKQCLQVRFSSILKLQSNKTPPVPLPDNTKSALVVIVFISLPSISISSTINLFVLNLGRLVKSAVKAPALWNLITLSFAPDQFGCNFVSPSPSCNPSCRYPLSVVSFKTVCISVIT